MTVFTHVTYLLSVHAYNDIMYIQHWQCLHVYNSLYILCVSVDPCAWPSVHVTALHLRMYTEL